MAEQNIPSKASDREPAEGSRETVESNAGDVAAGRFDTARAQRGERKDEDTGQDRDEDTGGITNRPLDEEIENQRELPDRGTARNPEEDHA